MSVRPLVQHFFQKETNNFSYLVSCPVSRAAALIDAPLNFSLTEMLVETQDADLIASYIKDKSLDLQYLLDTHSHADHLSCNSYLKKLFPNAKMGVSAHVTLTQDTFLNKWKLDTFPCDGSQFDLLLKEGQTLPLGSLEIQILETPGHTKDSLSFLIGDAIFVGDTLFKESSGTARCDFPFGNAKEMWDSCQKILSLDPSTRVFLNHDYGEIPVFESTVQKHLECNIHVKKGSNMEDYVKMRNTRDATLTAPKLLFPSIQYNIQAGKNVDFIKLKLNKTKL